MREAENVILYVRTTGYLLWVILLPYPYEEGFLVISDMKKDISNDYLYNFILKIAKSKINTVFLIKFLAYFYLYELAKINITSWKDVSGDAFILLYNGGFCCPCSTA